MTKNHTLLLCSFRYALGRQTSIVSVIVKYLLEDWNGLDEWVREQIKRDIRNAIERNEIGMDCDRDEWNKILNTSDTDSLFI